MIKHIITSGCSYSEPHLWPKYLQKELPNIKFYNFGIEGMGNEYISRSIFLGVNNLLKLGINYDEILVLSCWSSFFRLQSSFNTSNVSHNHQLQYSNENIDGIPTNALNFKFLIENRIIDEYDMLYRGLESIVSTQNLLKLNKINFMFFTHMNNFVLKSWNTRSSSPPTLESCRPSNTWTASTIFKKLPENFLINNVNCISMFENLIDWDHWWFYEVFGKVKYGGIAEWMFYNDPTNAYLEHEVEEGNLPGHPTQQGHKNFVKTILINLVNKKYEC